MVNALTAYSQAALTQSDSYRIAETGKEQVNSNHKTSNGDVVDTVEISAEAQALVQAEKTHNAVYDAKVSYYEQFRPTREGFSAYNLAQGIVDPSAQPFSQERAFDEVAQAARENLDSKYQQMRESGEPFDYNSFEGRDWDSLMGDLDRRALYAVSSNEGGAFTKEEQDIARNLMIGQQGMAMGLYNGPTRLAGEFGAVPPTSNADHMRIFKAGIQFMDQVSIEEQATSVEWAHQRAAMQFVYEDKAQGAGLIPENFNSDHPLVNLMLGALESSPGFTSDADVSSRKELLDEPWFQEYEDRLDGVIAQTRELYGLPAG